MTKVSAERMAIFTDDLRAVVAIAENVYDRASLIARKHGLPIRLNKKPDPDNDWTTVLELELNETEYRKGFNVTLSPKYTKPGTARIWSLVTDVKTGTWNQDIRDDVPLFALGQNIIEVLTKVDGWIAANDGLDPIECARQRDGTAYYWTHKSEDVSGLSTYEAEFGDSDWSGAITGDADFYEASLYDAAGNEVFNHEGGEFKELALKLEAEFAKRNAQELFNDYIRTTLAAKSDRVNAPEFQEFLHERGHHIDVEYGHDGTLEINTVYFYELATESGWTIEEHGYDEFYVTAGPGLPQTGELIE